MKAKILRNIFINVSVLFSLARLLAAGTSDGILNFSDNALRHPQPAFVTFDVPSAVNGTFPVGINPAGVITGTYFDANFVTHCFLRAKHGTITTFDVPGAVNGTETGSGNVGGPPINPAGAITGTYFDANFVGHGFLRAPDGSLTTFDVPGAVNGTAPSAINPEGVIIGFYTDASFANHGFVRTPDGTFTTLMSQSPSTAHFPRRSTRRGRSRVITLTRASSVTASCWLPTAPLPRLMPQAPPMAP